MWKKFWLIRLFIYFQGKMKWNFHTASGQSGCFEFLFYLVWPFYFLKWNRYFSACGNLPNSSCHFWKHKSVFFQISINLQCHQTQLLYTFSAQMLYTLINKTPLIYKFFETFRCSGQNSPNSSCPFWNDKSIPL